MLCPPLQGATWFETGAAMLNGGTLNWFAVPIANVPNPLPLFAVVAANVVLMGAVENYRRNGEAWRRADNLALRGRDSC